MLINIPTPHNHNGLCMHDYAITRVIMDHPEGGVVVMGDDECFHVVNKRCVGEVSREIAVNTR